MIGYLWKSFKGEILLLLLSSSLLLLLLLLLLLKNNININTQQFNKKKEMLGTKETELSHLGQCNEASFRNVSLK